MKISSISPLHIVTGAAAVAIIGGGGFVGGMKYQQFKNFRTAGQFFNNGANGQFGMMGQGQRVFGQGGRGQGGQGGPGGFGGRMMGQNQGFRPVAGEIVSQDDKSITVKLPDGSSKIILLSDTTTINKASESSKTDLKAGEKVMVFGTVNPDGSVTAQTVQLNPLIPALK